MARCPKCEAVVEFIAVNPVRIRVEGGHSRTAVAYVCPNCETLLSLETNPTSVEAILQAWRQQIKD
jgi:uncharacterized protein with PIN domain